MNQINPAKLRNSKWTAVTPRNKEKHFLICEVEFDEAGVVVRCVIEAVMTKNEYLIDWRELKNSDIWRQGWK